MTEQQVIESGVRSIGREMGVDLPVEEIAGLVAFLAEKLKGKGWDEAKAAGEAAAAAIKTEADAERSRRERLAEVKP